MEEKKSYWPKPSQTWGPNQILKGGNAYGLTDLFDSVVMTAYQINEEQYDWILERMSDDEMDKIVSIFTMDNSSTFGQKREALKTMNKFKKMYSESKII